MTGRSPFELAIDEAVVADDPVSVAAARQVYADWLDENGHYEDAAWLRELAVANKYPSKVSSRTIWGWFYNRRDLFQNGTDIVTTAQWDRLAGYTTHLWINRLFKGWLSRLMAEDALRRVLHPEWKPPWPLRQQRVRK